MSARQLRARLDRLTLSVRTTVGQGRDGAHNFTNSRRTHSQEDAKRAIGAVVPAAATGDPTTTIEAIREALALHVGGKGELTRLLSAPADELIGELERLKMRSHCSSVSRITRHLYRIESSRQF
jgi:hypothetical protein